jgi:hypothetical protein
VRAALETLNSLGGGGPGSGTRTKSIQSVISSAPSSDGEEVRNTRPSTRACTRRRTPPGAPSGRPQHARPIIAQQARAVVSVLGPVAALARSGREPGIDTA